MGFIIYTAHMLLATFAKANDPITTICDDFIASMLNRRRDFD